MGDRGRHTLFARKTMQHSTVRIFRHWIVGAGLSLLAVWSITALFTAGGVPEEWSPVLQRNLLPEGWQTKERTEGWASSTVGDLGLLGVSASELAARKKIVIWGDSFVEATQVSDDLKMHRQLSRLFPQSEEIKITPVSVGERWWSVADYLFRIPDYETALGGVGLHAIHLYTLEDTFPDQYPGARVSLFLSEPTLSFHKYDNELHELESPSSVSRLSSLVHRSELQFFLKTRKQLVSIAQLDGLRFAPGTAQKSTGDPAAHRAWNRFLEPAWGSAEPPLEAWRFLLRELDAVTAVPILFVYAPPTPALKNGHLILDNPEKNLVAHFSALCAEHSFGFVSLEEPFRHFQQETGRFPKGFHNSRPWEGHYNADGHRLVAEAIYSWIQENRHVVYPD